MIGESIAHYRILDKLGEGGMGVLYRARDARLGRDVALKLLRPDRSEEASRRRLVQEARAASALNHPHIVTVYDVGRAALQGREVDFIAMECLEGRSLHQVMAERALTVGETMDYAIQIAQALAVAHEAGLVHRDLKPANLMLSGAGQVKVLDFGLAKPIVENTAEEPAPTETTDEPSTFTSLPRSRAGALVGTSAYMSPEQVEGRTLDGRSDLFSLGIVLYEMLAGRRPFQGDSRASLVASILRDPPSALKPLRKDVPRELERIVRRCLAKDPRERHASAGELLLDLESCRARLLARSSGWSAALRRPRSLVAAAVVLAVAALWFWDWQRRAPERWARDVALPEMERLVAANDIDAAYWLARRVAHHLPGDPRLDRFWKERCHAFSLLTSPPGASVRARPYGTPGEEWALLGHTPLKDEPMPLGTLRLRVEMEGYEPVDAVIAPGPLARSIAYTLHPAGSVPAGMVHVPGGTFRFRSHPPVELDDFWLDRYEVTNRAYKEFVDRGGYRTRDYWRQPFVNEGRTLGFEQAMAAFRDATGRPGPATWELGTYPEGQAEYPVGGVSWFEAAAYAEFAGKALPSFYHWYKATDMGQASNFAEIIHFSNFGGKGPVAVGTLGGVSPFGSQDMAGNVQEWSASPAGDERYILGGAWNEPAHTYIYGERLPPWSREAANGFRCVRFTGSARDVPTPPERSSRDYSGERPASDEAFRSYRGFYAYDRSELSAAVEAAFEGEHWRREKVSFAAPYGHERVTAYLFLPRNARPPFQTIVFSPSGEASFYRTSDRLRMPHFDFVIRSGRAVLHPVYKGTYERRGEGDFDGPSGYRDLVVQQVKDFSRSLDYLETRTDIDRSRLGVLGVSSYVPVLVLALDERLKVGLAHAVGLSPTPLPGEIDPLNFAPRVRQPVLLLNGRYDSGLPVEPLQKPLFRLLATPEKDKRLVLVDSGHSVVRSLDRVRESLDWLDRHLGPVQTR